LIRFVTSARVLNEGEVFKVLQFSMVLKQNYETKPL
jgi:hypothetical protein